MNRRRFLASIGAAAAVQKWDRIGLDPVETEISPARYPYLQNVQADRATIMWTTLQSGLGGVQYSTDGVNYRNVAARSRTFSGAETGLPVPYTQYQANITGLTPDTEYTYRVFLSGATVLPGGDLRFRTAGTGPFNFFVMGDSGAGDSGLGNKMHQFLIAQQLLAYKPSLVVHTGDVVYPGGTQEYYGKHYFNYYYATMSSVPIFPCIGNHDHQIQNAAPYMAIHSVPMDNVPIPERGRCYSYDWGNVHFVSLDSNLSLDRAVNSGGQMLRWLANDLQSTRQFWRVVYFHHPPYLGGSNQNDIQCLWNRQYVCPILEAHGVQVVFSGHEHSYQRSFPLRKDGRVSPDTGTTYVVTGGGGAIEYATIPNSRIAFAESVHHSLRVEVQGPRMTIRAIRYNGTEIETFTLSPKPAFLDEPNIPAVTFQPSPTANALVRISGRSLSTEDATLCSSMPPSLLAGTTVTINDRPLSLVYVSSTQIYALLPFTPSGNITVKVTTANGSAEMSF